MHGPLCWHTKTDIFWPKNAVFKQFLVQKGPLYAAYEAYSYIYKDIGMIILEKITFSKLTILSLSPSF